MHQERHRTERIGWLRAAVLGANDGIVSTAALLLGMAGSGAASGQILTAGLAGMVAGALSMAAGEYVSVSSQADTESADLRREQAELARNPAAELEELVEIYIARGLTRELAEQVARQLMAHDALGSHARDELGIIEQQRARPLSAALASAATFATGALLPLLCGWLAPPGLLPLLMPAISLTCLALLGALAARAGGAPPVRGALRVAGWSALAMAATYGVGKVFGAGPV